MSGSVFIVRNLGFRVEGLPKVFSLLFLVDLGPRGLDGGDLAVDDLVSDFGFGSQISGFGFRVSDLGIRVSGFGVWDSGWTVSLCKALSLVKVCQALSRFRKAFSVAGWFRGARSWQQKSSRCGSAFGFRVRGKWVQSTFSAISHDP